MESGSPTIAQVYDNGQSSNVKACLRIGRNSGLTMDLASTYNALGFDMKGIRPEGCCPKCKKPFKWDNKKGYICKSHLTSPERYSVIVYFKGERIVRGTDFNGDTLRTFADAHDLRMQAEKEKRAGTFNPAKWKSKKKIEYSFEVLIDKWLTGKEELMEEGKRAPSYVPKLGTYSRLYFMPCYGDRDVREIFNLDEFKRYAPRSSLKYKKNVTAVLESFFRWCLKKHYISQLPDFPERIEVPEHIPLTIDKETQLAILEVIPGEHRPIFAWLFHQGCTGLERSARLNGIV